MLMVMYFPEPMALMKIWIEQIAAVQAAQAQFALMLFTPYFDAIKRERVHSKMQLLHLELVTNPATILKHRSHAHLSIVGSKEK